MYALFGGRSAFYNTVNYKTAIYKLGFDDNNKITYTKVGDFLNLYKVSKKSGLIQTVLQFSIDETNTNGVIGWVDESALHVQLFKADGTKVT